MTDASPQGPETGPPRLGEAEVSRLLRLGLGGPSGPLNELLDRLAEPGGQEWFLAALESGPTGACGPPEEQLIGGRASIAELRAMKERGKALVGKSASGDASRGLGVIAYFLAVAAALVHHGTLISSRPAEEIEDAHLDLASALPHPWSEFLGRAALARQRR